MGRKQQSSRSRKEQEGAGKQQRSRKEQQGAEKGGKEQERTWSS